jgi:hypothetical protein
VDRPAQPGGAGRACPAPAEPARRRGHRITAARFEEQATEAQQAARVVRDLLLGRDSFATAWPLVSDRQAPAVTPASEERGG